MKLVFCAIAIAAAILAAECLFIFISPRGEVLRWFTAFGNLNSTDGTKLAAATFLVFIVHGLLAFRCWWCLTHSPSACASLNPRFDPRVFFWRFLLVGLALAMVMLSTAALLTSKGQAFAVAAVAFSITGVLYFVSLWLLPAHSFRRALTAASRI